VGGCALYDVSRPERLVEEPVVEESALRIGLVTSVGGRGDKSFNDAALRGLELWAAGGDLATVPEFLKGEIKSLGVEPRVIESRVVEDFYPNLRTLAEEGLDLIVAVGFLQSEAVYKVAKEFPDVKFMIIDGLPTNPEGEVEMLPNTQAYLFRENEGSFLVGALAGLMTETNKVGFVGGMDIFIIHRFEAGYKAGVMTTNPEAAGPEGRGVLVDYTGDFRDPLKGAASAKAIFGKEADIIFAAAGASGIGVIDTARDMGEGYFAIGVDSDQDWMAPGRVLTSMLKMVDLAVYRSIESVLNETYKAEIIVLGVKEGGVDISPLTYTKDMIMAKDPQILDHIANLKQLIIEGTLVVPDETKIDPTGDRPVIFTPPATELWKK
ncbi:BMP family lipoprotein, partial [Candidatus Hakubella thermalkaliphila]